MSKFFKIDDWEPVDMASSGMGLAAGVAGPLTLGFSIFMMGEASASSPEVDDDGDKPAAPAKKTPSSKNIMGGMSAPKPTWA